jgi:site-specific DNA-methyltransferase (adenine-specific)
MSEIKLLNTDCIEYMKSLPAKSIDLIVTDPPYGLSYNQNDLASLWEAAFNGKRENMKPNGIQNDDEETAMELFKSFLIEAKRILKKGACCCCCCGGGPKPLFAKWTLMMDEEIGFKQAVIWNKPGLGMGIHFRRNYEFVLIAQKGAPSHRWNGGNDTPNVLTINKIIPSKDQHPTEKPYELMGHFIKLFSNEGDTVLDPFMGHGATGVAALKLNRNFIGCEIEERFFNAAKNKLEGVIKQPTFFQ